ncbi:hypothetical protein ACEWY4_002146 [Coilia grayii]|uniref:Uncharacterized protein n=1 Tax=Coilia grayii TaxID=363190 RepID=A0ABD1KW73_9TELE
MASQQIEKKKNELTTSAKLRKDTEMLLAPHANWDKYLTPAPMSVAVLGELVFISSKDDFSINKNPPKDGFKHMKYPNSFKASLMQVCNSGWSAFNEAHNSMDQIRLYTENVPMHVRTAVEIILNDDDSLMQIMLPNTLLELENIASACLALSQSTTENFQSVVRLVHELLEASTNAQQAYNQDLKKVNQTIQEYKIRQEAKDEASKRAEKDLKDFKEKWDAAEKLFDETMKKMPSGWDMIGMNLAEGLAESLNVLVSGLTSVVTTSFASYMAQNVGGAVSTQTVGGAVSTQTSSGSVPGSAQVHQFFDVKDVYSEAYIIANLVEQLKYYFKNGKIDWSALYDQKEIKAKSDVQKDLLVEFRNKIAKLPESAPKTEVLGLFDAGISICNKLGEIAPKGECDPGQEQKIANDIADLLVQAQTFNSKGRQLTKTNPMSQTPPELVKAGQGKKRASEHAVENARIQIAEARKALDTARDMYSKTLDRLEKNKQEMTDILTILASSDVQQIDFKTTLEFLGLGLKALASVKEQWEKMVQFFQVVTNIIKVAMNSATNTFVKRVEEAAKYHQKEKKSYSSVKFVKDGVYSQAFQVSNLASLINMMSTTYVSVSDQHIMGRISSLGRLMNLDVSSPEFAQERKKLQDGCKAAQLAIEQLVKKNKLDFQLQTEERLKGLTELAGLLPPASQEEEKKIQEIVNAPSEELDQYA